MNIYQKLIEVRKAVPYLQKETPGHQYKYTSSAQVLAAVRDKLNELGLLLIPKVLNAKVSSETVDNVNKEGVVFKKTTTYFTELEMEMVWVNADNPEETITVPWYGQGVDIAGEKGVGKALTYAEKYFILKQFNIPTDQDDPDRFQEKWSDQTKETNPVPMPTKPGNRRQTPTPTKPDDRAAELIARINELCAEKNLTPQWLEGKIQHDFKKKGVRELTIAELTRTVAGLEKLQREA